MIVKRNGHGVNIALAAPMYTFSFITAIVYLLPIGQPPLEVRPVLKAVRRLGTRKLIPLVSLIKIPRSV